MSLIIKQMEYKHLLYVYEIEFEAFAPSPWSVEMFVNELSNPLCTYVVGEIENRVVSYSGMWCIVDEAHLTTIAVKDKFRNMNIGSILLDYMIKTAKEKNMKSITLEVRKSNIPAQNLYKKFGFEIKGKRKRYYKTEDALIMTKIF